MSEVVVNVPQLSGFASGASGPLNNLTFKSLNGSGGFWSNTTVSWPVLALGSTWPLSLIVTLSAEAIRNSRYICEGVGEPMYAEPTRWSGSNGDVIETVPTLDAAGQLFAANCASVQPCRPLAVAGDS